MNAAILKALGTIAESYHSKGERFKYQAYRTAINTVKQHPTEINSTNDLKGAKGIGKAMLEKIDEILSTGGLKQEQEVLSDPVEAALQLFTSIHGIGPKLANTLVHEHGCRTLEDLENSGMHLNPQVRLGLKYHEESSQRIPYEECEEHLHLIQQVLFDNIEPSLIINCCGSHRRGHSTSGDVDVLITHPQSHSESGSHYTYLKHSVEALRDQKYIVDTLVEGPSKFMGYSRLPKKKGKEKSIVRRLDIRWICFDAYFPSVLYFTGSDMFNVQMRTEALKLGYTLNEYGLYKIASSATASPNQSPAKEEEKGPRKKGELVLVTSEEDIFKILRMKYVPPTQRNK